MEKATEILTNGSVDLTDRNILLEHDKLVKIILYRLKTVEQHDSFDSLIELTRYRDSLADDLL